MGQVNGCQPVPRHIRKAPGPRLPAGRAMEAGPQNRRSIRRPSLPLSIIPENHSGIFALKSRGEK